VARLGLIGLLLILAGLQYRLWAGQGSMAQVHQLQHQLKTIRQANQQQKVQNKKLAARIHDLKTGTAGVARLARTEMGYVKKGETFYMTVPAGSDRESTNGGTGRGTAKR